ncbi:hypothetical protein [Kitasatospora sp. GAS204B]|uniref:hypothetical protein n=1 Tax=unclassified Kitasatospora TaxID=2633591 RepID=UPI0024752E81|nr:hypothetical protein [Kitasatospora sp. GAS204B]MDH6116132.1 hypothetical protein [Kitasatospora sp. GAS204B]
MTPNPALADLRFLVGDWDMALSGAEFLPDSESTMHGSVVFEWIEDGAALVIRQGGAATWIIGRDDSGQDYQVLYADNRGVSRVYGMSLTDSVWRLWRRTPEFSQRYHGEISADRAVITGRWEKSVDGGTTWDHDFDLRYSRTSPSRS